MVSDGLSPLCHSLLSLFSLPPFFRFLLASCFPLFRFPPVPLRRTPFQPCRLHSFGVSVTTLALMGSPMPFHDRTSASSTDGVLPAAMLPLMVPALLSGFCDDRELSLRGCDLLGGLHCPVLRLWVAPDTPWYVVECRVSTSIDWNSNPAPCGGVGPLDTLATRWPFLDMY